MSSKKTVKLLSALLLFILPIFSYSQNSISDTLYLQANERLLSLDKDHPIHKNQYYLFKNSNNNGTFYFEKIEQFVKNKDTKKGICIKELLKNKTFYLGKNNNGIINDREAYNYFEKKIVFLIKKDSVIVLKPNYFIE